MKPLTALEEIYAPVDNRLKAVPSAILDILSTGNELASDVIRYFFTAQGKLLRPALAFLGAELKGAPAELDARLVPLASSFEIFHSATLIHDDIIDSAYVRRNIPTVNVKWGPEVAVLVGDYLHDKAIAAIFTNGNERIISLFLQTAGIVCDGEIHELKEKDNFNLREEEYLEIVDKKTASLLACCVEAGGILAGATPEEAEALKRFGRYFGIAFQIVDDCLDFTGNQEEFGKTLGADCAAGVLTLPLIRLLALVDDKTKSEVFKIFKSEMGTNKFQMLLAMMREHGTLEYSMDRAREYCDKARLELSIFPESPARRSLQRLVDYVLERNR
jgi:octaprenyl-diphosphate synthase